MAVVMKLFLVVVALVCCMQFVEMARLRRDQAAAATEPTFDFAAHFNEFVRQIKDSELMKQLQQIKPEEVQEKFQESLKNLQENFEANKDKFESFGKDIVESFNKNVVAAKTS